MSAPTKSRGNIPRVYDARFDRVNGCPVMPDEISPIQRVAVDAIDAQLQLYLDHMANAIKALKEVIEIENTYELPRRVTGCFADEIATFTEHNYKVRAAFRDEFKFILQPFLYKVKKAEDVARLVCEEMVS